MFKGINVCEMNRRAISYQILVALLLLLNDAGSAFNCLGTP